MILNLRNWWPLAWAALHLSGVVAGGALPVAPPPNLAHASTGWGRCALFTPLLACGTGLTGAVLAGTATFGLAGLWGWGEAAGRAARVDAVAPEPWAPAVAVRRDGRGRLRITGWSAPATGGRWRAPARVLDFRDDSRVPVQSVSSQLRIGDGVMLTGKGPAPPIGSVVACRLSLVRPRGAGIAGAFDYRRHLAGRGLVWTARTDSVHPPQNTGTFDPVATAGNRCLAPLQRALIEELENVLPPREASLGASVLLGARDPDSRRSSQPFADLGLAHLFAVSGLHVGILLGLVLAPARAVGLGPLGAAMPVLLLLPPYAVLTGLPGSVIRAAGLGALAVLAPCLGRRFDPLRGLGILYAASIAWEPAAAIDVGLRLSYLAAGGILAVSRATGGLRFCRRRPWSWLGSGLGVTLAAQWFTLPVAAQAFGRISLLAPVANLVAVPLFGAAVWMTVVALALGAAWLPAGQACGALGWLQMRLLAAGVGWTAARSGFWDLGLPPLAAWQICVWLALSIGLLAGLAAWRRAGRSGTSFTLLGLSAPLGLLLVVGPSRLVGNPGEVVLTQFDVGQGDCGLLVLPDGWTALMDTGGAYGGAADAEGPFAREVLPWLHRQGRRRVDALVLTHGHRDHTGGARAAAGALDVGRWYCGGKSAQDLSGIVDPALVADQPAAVALHRWREWTVDLVAAPPPASGRVQENDRSLVLVLRQHGAARLVWSGDLEERGEERLLAAFPELGEAQVWKAGHHGSKTSGSSPWLNRLQPDLVLISCGVGNRYRHPSHGPYVAAGDTLAVRRSDLHGTVTVRWDATVGSVRHRATWKDAGTDARRLP